LNSRHALFEIDGLVGEIVVGEDGLFVDAERDQSQRAADAGAVFPCCAVDYTRAAFAEFGEPIAIEFDQPRIEWDFLIEAHHVIARRLRTQITLQ
jgi:hypothetical protein